MSAARKLEVVEDLAQLIDSAGAINARINTLKKQYDAIRKRIAEMMPLVDSEGNPLITVLAHGEDFKAVHEYKNSRYLPAKDLHDHNEEFFWQLIKVDLGLAEKVLDPNDFNALVRVEQKDEPTLTVTKLKD